MLSKPKVEQSGNVRILTFTGSRIRDEVENVLADELGILTETLQQGHLLLDFTNVVSISSMELATLINLHKKVKAAGGRLTLFNLSFNIFEIFSITHLSTLFGICREQAESNPPPSA